MNTRGNLSSRIDYCNFKNWYTGLATMIIVQAVCDLDALGEKEVSYRDGSLVRRSEVIKFLNSRWVEFMATTLGADAGSAARRGGTL